MRGVADAQLLLTAALGGIVGLECEIHGRPAGQCTQILLAVGSTMAMIVSTGLYDQYAELGAESIAHVDPGRVPEQVVAGIGCSGTGAILKNRVAVRGLTMTASL